MHVLGAFYYPQGTVPITKVLASEQSGYEDGYNDRWTTIIREDMQGSEDMPVGVSVISRPYQDEVALGIMKQLETAINFNCIPKIVEKEYATS